jgi:hypothetical protein
MASGLICRECDGQSMQRCSSVKLGSCQAGLGPARAEQHTVHTMQPVHVRLHSCSYCSGRPRHLGSTGGMLGGVTPHQCRLYAMHMCMLAQPDCPDLEFLFFWHLYSRTPAQWWFLERPCPAGMQLVCVPVWHTRKFAAAVADLV